MNHRRAIFSSEAVRLIVLAREYSMRSDKVRETYAKFAGEIMDRAEKMIKKKAKAVL
jgi:hypothetical protein